MRIAGALVLLAAPAWPHALSMSSGDLVIRGTRAHYELRLPLYELSHLPNAQQSLFDHIRFSVEGRAAELRNPACHAETASYVCSADYNFAAPVERLDIDCTFYAVTVPNHVHLLRADNDGKRDQALLDFSFPRATLAFRPPSAAAIAVQQAGAGFMRALGGLVQILFLASLVLAARSRREMILLSAMFLAGQVAVVVMVPLTAWQPAARFVEAAAALTLAYLAVEILFLPRAGGRWLIVGILGAFHGLYFDLFLRTTGYSPAYVLAGAAFAEITAIGLFALVFARLRQPLARWRPVPVCAGILFVFGLSWFLLRLKG